MASRERGRPAAALLAAAEESLERGDPAGAKRALDEAERVVGPDHGELNYLRGLAAWERAGPEAARPWLERAAAGAPKLADVRYSLGLLAEELGDREEMIRHFLHTLELDAAEDERVGRGSEQDLDFIEREAEAALARLPGDLRAPLANVPIILEARPSLDLVEDGFDPRAVGLFEGLEQARSGDSLDVGAAPSRIVLYYANLLAAALDRPSLAEQIEITLFHEIGHYFGLDEDEVAELGLE